MDTGQDMIEETTTDVGNRVWRHIRQVYKPNHAQLLFYKATLLIHSQSITVEVLLAQKQNTEIFLPEVNLNVRMSDL